MVTSLFFSSKSFSIFSMFFSKLRIVNLCCRISVSYCILSLSFSINKLTMFLRSSDLHIFIFSREFTNRLSFDFLSRLLVFVMVLQNIIQIHIECAIISILYDGYDGYYLYRTSYFSCEMSQAQ